MATACGGGYTVEIVSMCNTQLCFGSNNLLIADRVTKVKVNALGCLKCWKILFT